MFNRTLYEMGLRDLLRSKKTLFAALVSGLPILLAILFFIEVQSSGVANARYYPILAEGLIYLGIVGTMPLACLLLAGGSIADEAEDRTLSYLLVRPIRRRTLFWSRSMAVFLVAAALCIFQVIGVWLVDVVSYLSYSTDGQMIVHNGKSWSPGFVLGVSLPVGVFVALLAAAMYTAMFSAISVMFTRYHFFANLAWFIIWEGVLGFTFLPTAWVSGNHALRSFVGAVLPIDPLTGTQFVGGLIALPVAVAYTALWIFIGMRVMERRDFHVTSAAT